MVWTDICWTSFLDSRLQILQSLLALLLKSYHVLLRLRSLFYALRKLIFFGHARPNWSTFGANLRRTRSPQSTLTMHTFISGTTGRTIMTHLPYFQVCSRFKALHSPKLRRLRPLGHEIKLKIFRKTKNFSTEKLPECSKEPKSNYEVFLSGCPIYNTWYKAASFQRNKPLF